MAISNSETWTPREGREATDAPAPTTPKALADLSLDHLAGEIKGNPEKLKEYLSTIPPIDYAKDIESQKHPIALTQAQLMLSLALLTIDMSDADFQKLDFAGLAKLAGEKGDSVLPKELKDKGINPLSVISPLVTSQTTPVGKHILDQWNQIRDVAGTARRSLKSTGYNASATPAPPTPSSGILASTLPPPGSLPQSSEGGLWQDTKNFVSENKTTIAMTGAVGVALYAAFRLFGGEGSKDESKWFSGITDWKVLTLAGIATAVGLYKFGPDWIKQSFEKFKSFFSDDKPSTLPPAQITDFAAKIVEFNNKENPSARRNTFPEKLIKSKGGMTVAEFTDKDGFFSNAMYTLNSGISWVTGTSGALSNDMKQDWNDYQLLLDYTKKKVKQHGIQYKEDDKMDSVWSQIAQKESTSK